MSTGDVIFVPPVIHRTFCPIDFANWPWGEQNCTLIFGSWTYHESLLDLQPLKDDSSHMDAIDTKEFVNPRVILFVLEESEKERERERERKKERKREKERKTKERDEKDNANMILHFQIKIVSTSYQRNSVKYDCCPENYPNLKFNIVFKQESVYMKDAEMKSP